jgi:L-aspartate oxidase
VLGEAPLDGIGCRPVEEGAGLWTEGAGVLSRAGAPDVPKLRDILQRAMTTGAGVVRSEDSLARARRVVDEVAGALGERSGSVEAGELGNLLQLAAALLASARARSESRGAHSRVEFPDAEPSWRVRQVHGAMEVGR